jgi:outer membrane protein TolC
MIMVVDFFSLREKIPTTMPINFLTSFIFLFYLFLPIQITNGKPPVKHSMSKVAMPQIGLKKILSLAKTRSPLLLRARIKVRQYEAMLSGSNLLRYPQFSLSLKGAPSPKYECVMPDEWLSSANLNGMSEHEFKEKYCVGTNIDDDITTELDGYALRFQVKAVLPLYTFGKIAYTKALAQAAVRGGQAGVKKADKTIEFLVKKAFYARKSALEIKKLVGEAVVMMAQAREKAEEDEEDSKITPTDLIRLKLGENLILRKKLEVNRMDVLTLEALKILTGKSIDIDVKSANPIPSGFPLSLKKLLKIARRNRPEIKMLKSVRAMKIARIGIAKAAFYPNIGLFARYTLKLSNSDDPQNAYYNDGLHGNSLAFGVGIEMKFDPSKMITELRMARLDKKETDARIAASGDLLKMQIVKSREEVIYNIKKIKLIIKGIKLSRAWVMALSDKESSGEVKPKEMVDSLSSWFKLKLSLAESRYQLNIAWASLSLAVGKDLSSLTPKTSSK